MKFKKTYIFRKKFCFITLLFFLLFPLNVYHHENIYVTLTSWKGRINFIHKGLETLLNNTIKPKKIILNLAIEEFPGKELQLPKEIIYLLKKYRNFEVFWVKKNNNVFKKIIPTINRYKKSLIISVDDDILYPNDLIENMLKCYKKEGGKNPMSFGRKSSDWHINGITINNKINEIYLNTTEERINKNIKCPDDTLYTYAALINGYKYIRCKDYHINLNLYINSTTFSQKNKKYYKIRKQYNNIIRNYIMNKYNITIEKLLKI